MDNNNVADTNATTRTASLARIPAAGPWERGTAAVDALNGALKAGELEAMQFADGHWILWHADGEGPINVAAATLTEVRICGEAYLVTYLVAAPAAA